MLSFLLRFCRSFFALTLLLGWATATQLCTHDESFIPDAVLRVTAQNVSQSCLPAKLTVLANGTAPGPELRLTAGKTQWIRVYNDMADNNLTMVTTPSLNVSWVGH